MSVVAITAFDNLLEKLQSDRQEVKARGVLKIVLEDASSDISFESVF